MTEPRNDGTTEGQGESSIAPLFQSGAIIIPSQILSIMMCIQSLVRFCQFVLEILSGNEIMMSIKGRNSI